MPLFLSILSWVDIASSCQVPLIILRREQPLLLRQKLVPEFQLWQAVASPADDVGVLELKGCFDCCCSPGQRCAQRPDPPDHPPEGPADWPAAAPDCQPAAADHWHIPASHHQCDAGSDPGSHGGQGVADHCPPHRPHTNPLCCCRLSHHCHTGELCHTGGCLAHRYTLPYGWTLSCRWTLAMQNTVTQVKKVAQVNACDIGKGCQAILQRQCQQVRGAVSLFSTKQEVSAECVILLGLYQLADVY